MIVWLIVLALTAPSAANDRALYETACARVAAAHDAKRGGFVARNGVPSDDAVQLALLRAESQDSTEWKQRALATIDWMRALQDSTGGGFYLSAAEATPRLSRNYKPASVNARRLENLIRAWRLTRDDKYRRDAIRVVDYFDRVLLDGRGGFIPGQGSGFDVVAEANGLAVHAWLEWASVTADRAKRDFALLSLDRVWNTCWVPKVGLVGRGSFGEPLGPPTLVDQVEVGRAMVLAAQLARRPQDAERARVLGDLLLANFEDHDGGFMTKWSMARDGSVRHSDRVPAENARAALFLCELTSLTNDVKYRDAARRAWGDLDRTLDKPRLDAAAWALAIHEAIEPTQPNVPKWPSIAQNSSATPWRIDITRRR
jgi:uncharacterized protein YyaL (SSP411 family)